MVESLVLATEEHRDELQRLQKILRCYQGFQLILALYNDPPAYRDSLIACLNQPFAHPALLDIRALPDFATFESRLNSSAAEAELIHVIGLDAWLLGEHRHQRLQGFNLHRESIAQCCTKPLLLWLPGYLARDFALQAPDCWEWRRAVVDFCYLPEVPQDTSSSGFNAPNRQLPYFKQRLARLSSDDYQRAKTLAVFHDAVTLEVLATLMDRSLEDAKSLADGLVSVDLATAQGCNHYSLEPGLCAYLRLGMDAQTLAEKQRHWCQAMVDFIWELAAQQTQEPERSSKLSGLEWPNFTALLEQWQHIGSTDTVIELCSELFTLMQFSGTQEQLARIAQVRDQAEQALNPAWGHARFLVQLDRIENTLQAGDLQIAYQQAEALLKQALQAGASAYQGAAYDMAMAHKVFGNVLSEAGNAEAALKPLQQAQRSFQALADDGDQSAALMVSVTLTGLGNCLTALGRFNRAVEVYQLAIKLSEKQDDKRRIAVTKGQLATVRLLQKDYQAALAAYAEAKDLFSLLNEPRSVATAWHQTGMVYRMMQDYEQADQAYRQALAINSKLGNKADVASSLGELGILYNTWGKLEQAVVFQRQAADSYTQLGNQYYEGLVRNNLADTLIQLQRYDEARSELQQAIACKQAYGHSAEPWTTWDLLCDLELACNKPAAAHTAKQQAIQRYLAYRRDGGENMDRPELPQLCQAVLQAIREQPNNQYAQELSALQSAPNTAEYLKPVIPKLNAILQGDRNPALADDPELDYNCAAELLLLLDALSS